MPLLRRILLALFALLPLVTLVHKNDLHRWDLNRSLMAAPDEFSYMLTADAILHGHISTQSTLGIDTFYPPGYSLLPALWSLLFGLTPFAAHLLNCLLLSAATLVVYAFSKRLLVLLQETPSDNGHLVTQSPRHLVTPSALALLIAGIFSTNWHVLEGALYVFSEPAFTLATFAWLALALKWPAWHLSPRKTLAVAALAIAAWSIRGAGLVCIAVTLLYPCIALLHALVAARKPPVWTRGFEVTTDRPPKPLNPEPYTLDPSSPTLLRRLLPIALILTLALAYQITITLASPNKSLAGGGGDSAAHGYPRQLLDGLTQRGRLHLADPHDWPNLAEHIARMAVTHLGDYTASFTPPFREPPDYYLRYGLSLLLGGLALAGFLHHLTRGQRVQGSGFRVQETPAVTPIPYTLHPKPFLPFLPLLHAYILAYFALYLLWPFNMTRFWAPILPVMLVFLINLLPPFPTHSIPRKILPARHLAAALLALLLLLNLEELSLQLNFYQSRLNLVSDSLAQSAATVTRLSPNPQNTLIAVAGSTEHFIFAWYLPRVPGAPPNILAELRSPNPPEPVEDLILQCVAELQRDRSKRLFIISNFTETNYAEVFANLQSQAPEEMKHIAIRRLYQNENITTVWELRPKPTP